MNLHNRTVEVVKDILKGNVKTGDIVIDATMGNGNDTLLLAELVGKNGKVYSFDIQDIAIERTKQLLLDNNITNVDLIKEGHENMIEYVKGEVSCVTFNLGYLPNGDEKITTLYETTLEALKQAMEILKSNGIITIVSYYGHENGKEEKEAIDKFLKQLDYKKYKVMKLENYNGANYPPIVYVIKKNEI